MPSIYMKPFGWDPKSEANHAIGFSGRQEGGFKKSEFPESWLVFAWTFSEPGAPGVWEQHDIACLPNMRTSAPKG